MSQTQAKNPESILYQPFKEDDYYKISDSTMIGGNVNMTNIPLLLTSDVLFSGGKTLFQVTDPRDILMFDGIEARAREDKSKVANSPHQSFDPQTQNRSYLLGLICATEDKYGDLPPKAVGTLVRIVSMQKEFVDDPKVDISSCLLTSRLRRTAERESRVVRAIGLDRFEVVHCDRQFNGIFKAEIQTLKEEPMSSDEVKDAALAMKTIQKLLAGAQDTLKEFKIPLTDESLDTASSRRPDDIVRFSYWMCQVISSLPRRYVSKEILQEMLSTTSTIHRLNGIVQALEKALIAIKLKDFGKFEIVKYSENPFPSLPLPLSYHAAPTFPPASSDNRR